MSDESGLVSIASRKKADCREQYKKPIANNNRNIQAKLHSIRFEIPNPERSGNCMHISGADDDFETYNITICPHQRYFKKYYRIAKKHLPIKSLWVRGNFYQSYMPGYNFLIFNEFSLFNDDKPICRGKRKE